ncbi:hypothetical protein C1645_597679 [Glomus cerebriforme]|uniref:Uncharacterized protein n=1 Tax=Glomus cerebriforme TaxID=658196 RepID=A0A397T6U3_9GLOM|nr:hypothetical protein C1645_597679 [Glomus cerebriforme]
MMEFERIGLRHLKETSSAVQEKQIINCTSYRPPTITTNRMRCPTSTDDDIPTSKRKREDYEDFNSRLLKDTTTKDEDDGEEKEEDDKELSTKIFYLLTKQLKPVSNSEWKLSSGELIRNVLSQKTLADLKNSKNKKLDYLYSKCLGILRLGLSICHPNFQAACTPGSEKNGLS